MSNDPVQTGREYARLISTLTADTSTITVCGHVTINRRHADGPLVGITLHTPDGTEVLDDTGQHLGTFP
jgi:hypothetical protein